VKGTEFVLVRHAETVWNREGRIQGQLDSPLSARGIEQARLLARRLQKESFDVLVSSDLARARRTAETIAAGTGHAVVLVDARLRERDYGIFQGLTLAEAEAEHPAAYAAYRNETLAEAIPGGESTEACFARNFECLLELAALHAGRRVVIVAHGGVLDGLHRHVTRSPHAGERAFGVVQGRLNWFTCEDGAWRLDRWEDGAHLGASALRVKL
jgi:2,3-bisphosphoglycerate-dependent phosphoglycerate mutase